MPIFPVASRFLTDQAEVSVFHVGLIPGPEPAELVAKRQEGKHANCGQRCQQRSGPLQAHV